jgi:hypothetical protein
MDLRVAEQLGMSPIELLGRLVQPKTALPNPDKAKADFGVLLTQRWDDVCQALRMPRKDYLTWDFGDWPHFAKPRGYAVMFPLGNWKCHVRFSKKMLAATPDRQDGVMRHELGHVVDELIPKKHLDMWAAGRGVFLPPTVERRADAIAAAIWGTPLRYDSLLVQSTTTGVAPRPEHLGL